jgi:hypothetical protein
VCHALLQDPEFFRLLLHADEELASGARSLGCACGGVLNRANYPRKPRGCPSEVRDQFSSRFSFCCNRCRRRTTTMSVRFLGRRVYLALVVVLESARHVGQIPAAGRLSAELNIPLRTLQRWREWWSEQFPLTPLWQADCARFMPPPDTESFPASLLERFVGDAEEALFRLLAFLGPLTVRPVALNEGR